MENTVAYSSHMGVGVGGGFFAFLPVRLEVGSGKCSWSSRSCLDQWHFRTVEISSRKSFDVYLSLPQSFAGISYLHFQILPPLLGEAHHCWASPRGLEESENFISSEKTLFCVLQKERFLNHFTCSHVYTMTSVNGIKPPVLNAGLLQRVFPKSISMC